MPSSTPIVDIHTHMYPPSLLSTLRSRTVIPYVRSSPDSSISRLVILPSEESSSSTSAGRPIGPEYSSISQKIAFMDAHGIDISVISLANPWLDWVEPAEAAATAKMVNDEMESLCSQYPGRLYTFGTLPLSGTPEEIVAEISRLKTQRYCRGIVMGTSGLGSGLDDPALEEIWSALSSASLPIFLHPHYGLPTSVFGPRASEYGHVLPLAMGFPLETTIAITRMILSGVFDQHPTLQVLLAHSGGTLPFLAGRIESCIAHDSHLKSTGKIEGRRDVWEILKSNIYLDAVIYGEAGLKAAVEVSGADRVMFGTDHPFFPPLDGEEKWLSVTSNVRAVEGAFGKDEKVVKGVMGGNAVRVLRLGE